MSSTPIRPMLGVYLSAADLELIAWRLCQPNYSEIGGYWDRHHTGMTAAEYGSQLYQRLMLEWDAWADAVSDEDNDF